MNIEIAEDPRRRGAQIIGDAIESAIDARGRCTLALSRGRELFRHLASADLRWDAVDLFQVDERVAPEGAPERNLTAIELELVANIVGPTPIVHAMPVTDEPEEGARVYAGELERACGTPPVLDVVHLGLGPDGHTASLVPDDPVLEVADRWVAMTGPYEGYRRMTLTFPVLGAARTIVIVASGAAKAGAVAALRAGDRSVPAARIEAADMTLVIDAAAAAENTL